MADKTDKTVAHRTDPGAFAAGIFYLVVAGLFGGAALAWLDPVPLKYLVPGLAVGYAAVLMIGVLSRGRRGQA
ncbi:hypothetical protein [Actinocorallia sp. A-T 12471]|uniref:hypothetical protein n=1 Tax=Actinocorallia sp. A-T 12471 TaxID=3089813 RepID=UPI0029D3F1F4|nr:hypothetical protein [Actinocorallia sp. A-T 12471]MDX6744451.1 hypothetical protein [Actinocorallia sp. A-T 12471]